MAMEVIESGCNIDVIYTDFAMAFDSLPHQRLLTGEFLKWMMSFLTGRKHKVCVDGELSTWAYTKNGIEVKY